MIDVLSEELIDFKEAASLPAFRNPRTRRPCHKNQLHRYCRVGAKAANGKRVQLEHVRCPGGLRTSREAVSRFIKALTDPSRVTESAEADMKATTRADADLQKAGW